MIGLRKIRVLNGFSQKNLADISGVNVRMIQHYEQGTKDISKAQVSTVILLAHALDCSVEDLIEIVDDIHLDIKVYNSNWEFVKGNKVVNIQTSMDDINCDLFDSVDDILQYIVFEVSTSFELTQEEIEEIITLCNIHFSSRFI